MAGPEPSQLRRPRERERVREYRQLSRIYGQPALPLGNEIETLGMRFIRRQAKDVGLHHLDGS